MFRKKSVRSSMERARKEYFSGVSIETSTRSGSVPGNKQLLSGMCDSMRHASRQSWAESENGEVEDTSAPREAKGAQAVPSSRDPAVMSHSEQDVSPVGTSTPHDPALPSESLTYIPPAQFVTVTDPGNSAQSPTAEPEGVEINDAITDVMEEDSVQPTSSERRYPLRSRSQTRFLSLGSAQVSIFPGPYYCCRSSRIFPV